VEPKARLEVVETLQHPTQAVRAGPIGPELRKTVQGRTIIPGTRIVLVSLRTDREQRIVPVSPRIVPVSLKADQEPRVVLVSRRIVRVSPTTTMPDARVQTFHDPAIPRIRHSEAKLGPVTMARIIVAKQRRAPVVRTTTGTVRMPRRTTDPELTTTTVTDTTFRIRRAAGTTINQSAR
jgi:hypothetical protein